MGTKHKPLKVNQKKNIILRTSIKKNRVNMVLMTIPTEMHQINNKLKYSGSDFCCCCCYCLNLNLYNPRLR